MNSETALDRLTSFTITRYAHTNPLRGCPEELSDEAFDRNRRKVVDFLLEAIPEGCPRKSLGQIFYETFSPISRSHPFSEREEEQKRHWEEEAKGFMGLLVAELRKP